MSGTDYRDRYNAFKGLCVVLIVLGHNSILTFNFGYLFRFLYSFHVMCFLLLPFIQPSKPMCLSFVKDRFVRYIVPYSFFLFVSVIIYNYWIDPANFSLRLILNILRAWAMGSADALDNVSGFQLFWFLPTLFILVVFRSLYVKLAKAKRFFVDVNLLLIHLTIGALPDSLVEYFPLGIHIVAYVFFLGIVVEKISSSIEYYKFHYITIVFIVLFLVASWICLQNDNSYNIAVFKVYDFRNFRMLLMHDLLVITSFFSIWGVSWMLSKVKLLIEFGRNSLSVFLIHSFAYYALVFSIVGVDNLGDPSCSSYCGVFTFIITLIVTLSVSRYMQNNDMLRRLIFPVSYCDFYLSRFLFIKK